MWWKEHYKISRADERYVNASFSDVLEDFLEYVALNENELSPALSVKEQAELNQWEKDIWSDPDRFDEWAQRQQDKIKKVNAALK